MLGGVRQMVMLKIHFFVWFSRKLFSLKIASSVFFFSYFIQSWGFLCVAYRTVANLARLAISVHCQVSVRSQYLVRLLSQCWITGGHTIHPPIEGLLPPIGIEPTLFRNSASKVAGLQVHATTPSYCHAQLDHDQQQLHCLIM